MTEHTLITDLNPSGPAHTSRPEVLKNWLKLLLWVAIVLSFMFYWGPWLIMKTPGYKPVLKAINDQDINANAYFYSDVDEFFEGHYHLENTRDYRPTGKTKK